MENHEITNAWVRARDALGPDALRLGWWALDEIGDARKPTIQQAANSLHWPEVRARVAVERLEVSGLLTRKDDDITGSLGLTYLLTKHALTINGHRLHVWCALDAIGIPLALQADAAIQSTTRDHKQSVHLDFRQGRVVGTHDLEIFVPAPGADVCFVDDACPDIEFYPRGRAPRHELANALSLEDAAELGRHIWARPKDPKE